MSPRKADLKVAKKPPVNDIEDEEIIEQIDEDQIKETKFDNMLAYLRGYEDDFSVSIYKKEDRKRVLVDTLDCELPDPITDLRDKYGGGNFRIMVFDGKGQMLDSADINVAQKPVDNTTVNQSSSRQDILTELESMARILGNTRSQDNNSNDILLKLMEMQNKSEQRMNEVLKEMSERFTQLFIDSQKQKTALTEFVEIAETINALRGDESSSPIEKLLSNPMAQGVINTFMQNMNQDQTRQNKNIPNQLPVDSKPSEPVPTKKQIIQKMIDKLPDDFKEKITKENAGNMINGLYESNKNWLDMDTANLIIMTILNQKGKSENGNKQ